MEFKKKTIIWEDNNEPPKDYIWIKSDGKAYEFDYKDRKWVESKSISVESGDSGSGSGEGSVDEQSLVTEALNSIITPPSEGNVIYPDAYIFFDSELEEYMVLDTVKALVNHMSNINPVYKAQPTSENIYFMWSGDELALATLEDSTVHEATINGITYYYLTEIAA